MIETIAKFVEREIGRIENNSSNRDEILTKRGFRKRSGVAIKLFIATTSLHPLHKGRKPSESTCVKTSWRVWRRWRDTPHFHGVEYIFVHDESSNDKPDDSSIFHCGVWCIAAILSYRSSGENIASLTFTITYFGLPMRVSKTPRYPKLFKL